MAGAKKGMPAKAADKTAQAMIASGGSPSAKRKPAKKAKGKKGMGY